MMKFEKWADLHTSYCWKSSYKKWSTDDVKDAWDFLMRQWVARSGPWVEDLEDCIAAMDSTNELRRVLQVVVKDIRETRDER